MLDVLLAAPLAIAQKASEDETESENGSLFDREFEVEQDDQDA